MQPYILPELAATRLGDLHREAEAARRALGPRQARRSRRSRRARPSPARPRPATTAQPAAAPQLAPERERAGLGAS